MLRVLKASLLIAVGTVALTFSTIYDSCREGRLNRFYHRDGLCESSDYERILRQVLPLRVSFATLIEK